MRCIKAERRDRLQGKMRRIAQYFGRKTASCRSEKFCLFVKVQRRHGIWAVAALVCERMDQTIISLVAVSFNAG